MMKVQLLKEPTEMDYHNWNKFNLNHPGGNFFQSPAAFKFFIKAQNYSPFVLFGFEESELKSVLCGVFLSEKGLQASFSNRLIIWGGPLVVDNNISYADCLLLELRKISSAAIYTEFRNLFDTSQFRESFLKNGFSYQKHLNYIVPITSLEEQKKKISKSKLRQINSSIKKGAYIEEANNQDEILQFYSILQELYQKKIGKPLPPKSFFEDFFHQKNLGKILLVKYNSEIIGGILCPIYQNKIIYEWYIAGLAGKFKGIYPSVLATWAPIEYAAKNKISCFDFLGAGSPDNDYGVREFKSKFGGNLVENGRYIRINKPIMYRIGRIGLNLYNLFQR